MVKENKDERQTMVYKILHKKLKTEETIFHSKSDVDVSPLGGLAVPAYKIMLVSFISTTMDTTVGAGTANPPKGLTSTSDFKWSIVSSHTW
jgi:hypothetical protein